jgi:hypothetical protein
VAAQSEALMSAVSIAVLAQQRVGPAGILDAKVDNRARIRILATRRGENFRAAQKLRY